MSIDDIDASVPDEAVQRAVEALKTLDRVIETIRQVRNADSVAALPNRADFREACASISAIAIEAASIWSWLGPDWDGESEKRILAPESDPPQTPAECFAGWPVETLLAYRVRRFVQACASGNTSVAKWLHTLGGIDATTGDHAPFRMACAGGHLATAQWLHSLGGVDLHACDDEPIRLACIGGHAALAKWLHACGVASLGPFPDATRLQIRARSHTSILQWLDAEMGPAASAVATEPAAGEDEAVRFQAKRSQHCPDAAVATTRAGTALPAPASSSSSEGEPADSSLAEWSFPPATTGVPAALADSIAVWLLNRCVDAVDIAPGSQAAVIAVAARKRWLPSINTAVRITVPPGSVAAVNAVMLALRGCHGVTTVQIAEAVRGPLQCAIVSGIRGTSIKILSTWQPPASSYDGGEMAPGDGHGIEDMMFDPRLSPLLATLPGSALEQLDLVRVSLDHAQETALTAALPWSQVKQVTTVACLFPGTRTALLHAMAASDVESFRDWEEGSFDPEEMPALAMLVQSPSFRHFDGDFGGFQEEDVEVFAKALASSRMTTLELGYYSFPDGAFAEIVAAAAACPTLTTLALPESEDADFAATMKALLTSGLRKLQLRLDAGSAEIAEQIRSHLPGSNLTSLSLEYTASDEVHNLMVSALCCSGTSLTDLKIGTSENGDAVAIALATALPHTLIDTLTVEGSSVGDAGATALAGALAQSRLRRLTLAGTGRPAISPKGIAAIAAALPASGLTSLSLTGQVGCGDAGVSAIAAALSASSLVELNLCNTGFSDAGALALASVLPTAGLRVLDTAASKMSAAAKAKLSEASAAVEDPRSLETYAEENQCL